jgi:hypothetical protein
MTPTNESPEKKRIDYAALSSQAFKIGALVGIITLFIILVAVFGGLWLDRQFAAKPLFTILLVLASAPVSLWLTFRVARRALRSMELPPERGMDDKNIEGDKTGE